jgi:hypothetical protein
MSAESLKYASIFSALLPVPEAKMAMRFIVQRWSMQTEPVSTVNVKNPF